MSARTAKHCHLCGRRLWGGGWVYTPDDAADDQALVVCRRCHETAPRCECGLPLGDHGVYLPDGRRVCSRCGQTAVSDPDQARTLFERVTGVIVAQLGLDLSVGAEFAMADPQHLRRLVEKMRPALTGPPERVVGLFVRKGRRRVMYILSGLPQLLFIKTVAHEWAHAWQGENCPLLKDPQVYEGFAEWVAYHTLLALGAVRAAARMEQRQGLYGDGLRDLLARERASGAPAVLAFCRQSE